MPDPRYHALRLHKVEKTRVVVIALVVANTITVPAQEIDIWRRQKRIDLRVRELNFLPPFHYDKERRVPVRKK
ncbi:MAG: hypothetical protein WAT12_14575 [Candidatus Nitrotoga sp.]